MPKDYRCSSIKNLRSQADRFVKYYDKVTNKGKYSNEIMDTQFITAFSSSSFIGVQSEKKSNVAWDSMYKSLHAHNSYIPKDRKWIIDILRPAISHVIRGDDRIMYRTYGDIMKVAKMSSSSIKGGGKFRDWVFEHPWSSIMEYIGNGYAEFCMIAGFRNDRRGKWRLICSMHAITRVVDFILTNGSYSLCEKHGVFGKYTTEGLSNKEMFPKMKRMCSQGDYVSLCIDYSGYDSQISLKDYKDMLLLLHNDTRDEETLKLLEWFVEWLDQPKPLILKTGEENEVLIECYRTLPSGMHMTHSLENLWGIATYMKLVSEGYRIKESFNNGDDQNMLVHTWSW